MRVRFTGPDARLLAMPGGCIECPPGEWVDVAEAAAEAHIAENHLLPAVLGLVGHPQWDVELDGGKPSKPKRGHKPKVVADPPAPPVNPEPETPADPPAEPDEETS